MAVIFAVVGGGAIVGIASSDTPSKYSDYSDYSYSDYGNYSDYSDAAERRARRRREKESEIANVVQSVNQYKKDQVNGYLQKQTLISQSGEVVSVNEVKADGYEKIENEQSESIGNSVKSIEEKISEIDATIASIDRILVVKTK